jgi:GntR family transcriptional regulator/MocR family aminotransferase
MLTRGVATGVALRADALLRPGDRVGVEEPGYPAARAVFAARGVVVVPCPVDSGGIRPGRLPAGLRLLYTTPAHQYPLGGRLSVPRRRALAAWARSAGALIVEDDYDSEFRYDVAPLPALYGLDPAAVVYLGTTAKTLTPALGVGWLVASPELVSALAGKRPDLGDRTQEAAQHAVHTMIENGDLERHIRRMRHEYARRRAAIVSILGDPAVPARLLGDTAGLHVVLELADGAGAHEASADEASADEASADEAAAAARDRGVAVPTLRRYFAGPPTMQGLVLGYGGAPLHQVVQACELLRETLRRGSPASPTPGLPRP